jgi:16S rRNA (uracil1498-N3)-methyltransferase
MIVAAGRRLKAYRAFQTSIGVSGPAHSVPRRPHNGAVSIHRVHIDEPVRGGPFQVTGEEAHHAARVKRIAVGEAIEILDGRGGIGFGSVSGIDKERDGWRISLQIVRTESVQRPRPVLEVCTAIPKGARLTEMIDGLAQAGAAVWRPLEAERSIREHWRQEKLERVAAEASKQCGRAWRLEVADAVTVANAISGDRVILADVSGERFTGPSDITRLLIGPEGGWTPEELSLAKEAGARVCRFGVHTMRIETAAVVAAGIIMQGG